jgi:hypothetical protein
MLILGAQKPSGARLSRWAAQRSSGLRSEPINVLNTKLIANS